MKVLNLGSLNLDYVYTVDHAVAPGETLASSELNIFCGGKGLNQSLALAKAGIQIYHAGLIGEDGDILLDACRSGGINTKYIKQCQGKTGHAVIQVDKNGQNCILLYGGTNRRITREYVDYVLADFEEGDIILLQNEINEMAYIIEKAYERGMVIILNPSPYDSALDACDFNKISMFLLNEIEGGQVTGETEVEKILEKLNEMYPDAKVVLTLGGEGSVYRYKDEQYRQGIYKVKTVDTTAAGDTFTGYFIASMIEGMKVQKGLEFAAKASAIAVSREGAAASIPLKKEVEEF